MTISLNRRSWLAMALAAGSGTARSQPSGRAKMQTRPIPSTSEALPVIGCGTYLGFDQASDTAGYAQLPAVVDALFAAGGSAIDSSPMYGRAEATTGAILAAPGRRD